MLVRSFLALILSTTLFGAAYGQYIPRQAQIRTDPITGSVAGGQFRTRTDPEPTVGSIYINPPTTTVVAPAGGHYPLGSGYNSIRQSSYNQSDFEGDAPDQQVKQLRAQLQQAEAELQRAHSFAPGAFVSTPFGVDFGADQPFDSTRGLRNYQTPFGAPEALNRGVASRALLEARAIGVDGITDGQSIIDLYQQPLIQIKVRVIEVVRDDSLQANSILEYVSNDNNEPSLTSGLPANGPFQNFRNISRFASQGLVNGATSGSGMLLNLTSEHINAAIQLLSNHLNADVVTAPQVVTLNGQNVEFVSGQKIPFQLGQNVIQGTNNNIQQFFYKNVGTYVSVTPKIVNWGLHGEGQGEKAIVSGDVANWHLLCDIMLDPTYFDIDEQLRADLVKYAQATSRVLPFELKTRILAALNKYSPQELSQGDEINGVHVPTIKDIDKAIHFNRTTAGCNGCDWAPEDCTIDLALVVRLSDKGTQTISTGAPTAIETNVEENVRAVANVIQIKSGEGVVMAGLIGQREVESAAKVPVLGDLPIVGTLFRNKEVLRQKTEVLIFLEAEVLDPRPMEARFKSGQDFELGQPYLGPDVNCSPLNCGLKRIGFGQYLPQAGIHEDAYWQRCYRATHRMRTHVGDILK